MTKSTFDRFKEVFDEVFIDEYEISTDTKAEDIEEWDSMTHINLVKALEDEFKIKFNLGEIAQAENIGKIVILIDQKVG